MSYGREYFKLVTPPVASFECDMLPLNMFAARGDLTAVRRLLPASASGSDADVVSNVSANDDGWTPLIEVSRHNYTGHNYIGHNYVCQRRRMDATHRGVALAFVLAELLGSFFFSERY